MHDRAWSRLDPKTFQYWIPILIVAALILAWVLYARRTSGDR